MASDPLVPPLADAHVPYVQHFALLCSVSLYFYFLTFILIDDCYLIIDNLISLVTCPLSFVTPLRANDQNRTDDLILTMDVLYRLSYIG